MLRSELSARVAVAAVGIPTVLGALFLGGWALGLLVAGVAGLATREFYHLAEARGVRPFTWIGVAGSLSVVLLATAHPSPRVAGGLATGVVILVAFACLAAAVWLRWPGGEPLAAVAVTVTGVVYVGVALAFAPLLRALPEAVAPSTLRDGWHAGVFLLLPLASTWAGDSAAYFVGRAWGRRKLAPSASPGKTVVGAVAGLAGSAAAAALVSAWALEGMEGAALPVATATWIGVLLGAGAQVGDLAESVLKREAGVKDSGTLLPGHGGMLDRIDALLASIPLAWALLAVTGVGG